MDVSYLHQCYRIFGSIFSAPNLYWSRDFLVPKAIAGQPLSSSQIKELNKYFFLLAQVFFFFKKKRKVSQHR
ncbi:hypothetical protein C5S32_08290 [ANME-1 cluster archaeon GoMg1]|nr:hypothetical protein [ANME-1 cluster archaeon GoMg1]